MRRLITIVTVLLFTACVSKDAKFPSRPIELIIAFPPGGVTDLAGRVFADEMSRVLGVPVVPVNRGGASGVVGTSAVLQSNRDGYVLLGNTITGMVLSPAVLKDAKYEADKDFVPIALMSIVPNNLAVRSDSPYRSLQDLIAAARQKPGKLSYASPGSGSNGHFDGEIFASAADIKIKHVPFRGGGELATAVLGGHVDFGVGAITNVYALEKAGKLKSLAITGNMRFPGLPDVPTFEELGLKANYVGNWSGCFAPAGTPKEIVQILIEAAKKAVDSPRYRERIEKVGALAPFVPPEDFLSMIRRDKKMAAEVAARLSLGEPSR
ncbi:MAG: tripartite tricarboxylate transporter substrate binding protein [Acidobacteria bacterium]|nr:tripartite tricarboxylate transporter substrate binding protein [Acidobacteriota bacterium]